LDIKNDSGVLSDTMDIKKFGWLIFLFSLQGIFLNAKGQISSSRLLFNYLTIEEGLPNNKVNSIEMDTYGFMWFATNDGVCRFDGLEVKQYGLSDYSIAGDQVRTSLVNRILIDDNGQILIGAYSLFYYNKITDKFEKYPFGNAIVPLKRIRTLEKDSKSRIWIGDQTGLYSFSPDAKDSLISYPYSETETIDVLSILPLGDSLLIGTNKHGVLVYNIKQEKFSPFSLFKDKGDKNKALCFFNDASGTIWMGTNNNGIFKFHLKELTVTHKFLVSENDFSNRIRDIEKDNDGNIWIGSRRGLYKKDANSEDIILSSNVDHPYSKLLSNSIFNIFIDRNQDIWLGTFSGGVNYADLNRKPFSHFSAKEKNAKFLNSNIVTCFCEDKNGDVYIGTENGVNFFDRRKEEFTYYMHDNNNPNSISNDAIRSVVCDISGNLWIGCGSGGLNYFNTRTKTFNRLLHDPKNSKSLNSDDVNCLALDQEQNLWIATEVGIDMLPSGEKNFQHIYNGTVEFLYQSKAGALWAGTSGDGLYLLNRKSNKFERQYKNFVNSTIHTMLVDSENNLWVGGNRGITFINTADSIRYNYSTKNGLPSNIIMGILEDEQKNLWISTTSGLLKYEGAVLHPDSLNYRNYSLSDGIQSRQFYTNSYLKDSSNEMFFGGINGFNMFNPALIKENRIPPKLVFTELRIFNKRVQVGQKTEGNVVLTKPLNETHQINLSYKQKVVTFDFVAIHYSNPKHNKYRYKLMPLENDWNYTSAERSDATYTNLQGGEYTFMVEASNSDGFWNDSQLRLSVTVSPPFWQTWWFIVISVLLIVIAIVSYYLHRIASLRRYNAALEKDVSDRTEELNKQKERLQELNLMKDKFLSIIAHDLRNPFQSLLGFTDLLESDFNVLDDKNKFTYITLISQSAKKIYSLLTNLLTWSRAQNSKISFEPKVLDLHEIIEQTLELLRNNYENKSIIVSNQVRNSVNVFADKNMSETILRNIISNAIKFTSLHGEIVIDSLQIGSMIQVSIKDTGVGMTENEVINLFAIDKTVSKKGTLGEPGTGFGLLICKEFILKNGGKIWVESHPGHGSTFFFTLKKPDENIS
jgi:signal transduction histidine kinase/ligand-binding sensor domain-containing protein